MGAYELVSRLEALRKEIKFQGGIIGGGIALFIIAGVVPSLLVGPLAPLAFFVAMGVVAAGSLGRVKKEKEFKELYKKNFVSAMLSEFFEDAQYIWDRGFDQQAVREFGLSILGNRFYSEDYISGRYKGIFFEQSDVKIQYHTSGKNSHTTTYFSGRMFVFQFPRHNVRPIQVFSERFAYRAQPAERFRMHKVNMESVEFNRRFDVKAADEHEAFYVLTPPMMEKLMELQNKYGNVAINFDGDRVFLGYNCGMGAFDANMSKPIDYQTEKMKMKQDMQVIMDIIETMSLEAMQ